MTALSPPDNIFQSISSIRQKYLDLKTENDRESIETFLKQAITYLKKTLDPNTADEIFSAISICFSRFPNYSLPFLEQILDNFKVNENYIIIAISIIYDLTYNQPHLKNSNYSSFLDDSLKEIQKQFTNENMNNQIILYGHSIPIQFSNSLILNLFLLSELTDTLISNFFPYILIQNLYLNNPKFSLILENLAKSGYLHISPLSDTENKYLFDILSTNFEINVKINIKTLLFITSSVFFTRNEGKVEINGLTTETILPFFAITVIYHQKYRPKANFSFPKINGLLLNSITSLNQKNSSPIFDVSINIILNNLEYLYYNDFISNDDILQIIIILLEKLIKNEYISDKNILISNFFDFSTYNNLADPLKKFIETNQIEILDFIFQYLLTNNTIYKKLNLNIFNKNLLINHIQKLINTKNIVQLIYVIDNFCFNTPKNLFSSQLLQKTIQDKTKEKSLNDVLFEKIPNENSDIDDILSYILSDPHPEENSSQRFTILFNRMIKDEEIYQSYISYNIFYAKFGNFEYTFEDYLDLYLNERNSNEFIEILKQILYIHDNKILINFGFQLITLKISEFGLSIISKLFTLIKEKPDNHQAFICLKNIAYSFPFLFVKDPPKMFNTVLPYLDYFYLIFEDNLKKKSLNLAKTAYAASFFIYLTFQSSFILDSFYDWLFCNITKFTNSQIFGFFMILINLNDIWNNLNISVFEKCIKHKFFKTCKNLLGRNIKNKIFQFYYKKIICQFISMINISTINHIDIDNIKKRCIELDEYSKIEQGLYILSYYTFKYAKMPYFSSIYEIELHHLNNSFFSFILNLSNCEDIKLFYNKNEKQPSEIQIIDFISKINKNDDLIYTDALPNFPSSLSIKMYRCIITKNQDIYLHFNRKYVDNFIYITKENYKQHKDAI